MEIERTSVGNLLLRPVPLQYAHYCQKIVARNRLVFFLLLGLGRLLLGSDSVLFALFLLGISLPFSLLAHARRVQPQVRRQDVHHRPVVLVRLLRDPLQRPDRPQPDLDARLPLAVFCPQLLHRSDETVGDLPLLLHHDPAPREIRPRDAH